MDEAERKKREAKVDRLSSAVLIAPLAVFFFAAWLVGDAVVLVLGFELAALIGVALATIVQIGAVALYSNVQASLRRRHRLK